MKVQNFEIMISEKILKSKIQKIKKNTQKRAFGVEIIHENIYNI